jgi:hypothetical protein
MRVPAMVEVGALVLSAAVVGAQSLANRDVQADALRAFQERVEAYAALHRRLAEPLPSLAPTDDTHAILLARKYLASAICAARPTARQGDIFTPPVAMLFRGLIAEALEARNIEALLADLNREHTVVLGIHPVINEPYPAGVTHEVPVVLLQWLPDLPPELQYRVVDHDLVVWDSYANLVIDYLPEAFSDRSTTDD